MDIMKKEVNPETNIQFEYSEISKKFTEFLQEAKEYRATWEVRSFVNESFYNGNHRVMYDRNSKQVVSVPIKSDNNYSIQKIRKTVRGVKGMITKNDPRWHIKKGRYDVNGQPLTSKEKAVAVALLQTKYKEEHIKDKIKDLLTHSLNKTLAWAFVGFDNRKDDIDIFIEDPFNIYTSPDGRLEGPVFVGKYMIRTIRKSLNDIKNSSLYNKGPFAECLKRIVAENKQAESDMKDAILSNDYKIPVDCNGSAIVKELYVLEPQKKEKKEKGEKYEKTDIDDTISVEEDQLYIEESRIRIITMVGDVIIRDELTPYRQYPFLAYQPERCMGLLYAPSWIEPLIELNRSLNEGYSNRADWLDQFAKGRYLMPKGSKMSVIKGRNGQIVEYVGQKPTLLDRGNLPQEVSIHLSDTERFMEDIGGVHSESMGRLSASQASGVAIAQLQAADNNNVSEPVDNLKTFMEELAYRVLDLASRFYKLQKLEVEGYGNVDVIGSEVKLEISEITGKPFESDIIEIKPLKNIEVEIVPGSAFSDLQARQDLVELKGLGVPIPDSLIIETYKLGNTEQIINDYEQEQLMKEKTESGMEGLETSQAELENKKMLSGIPIAVQEGEDHKIHLAIHGAVLKSIQDNPQLAQILQNHMLQHESLLQGNEKMQPKEQVNQQIPTQNIGQIM